VASGRTTAPRGETDPHTRDMNMGAQHGTRDVPAAPAGRCSRRRFWSHGAHVGPLRLLAETLPPDRVQRLKQDVDDYHAHYAVPAGLHVKREYLITIGRRAVN
jgi:hypothetical protein